MSTPQALAARRQLKVREMVNLLEQAIIDCIADYGLDARRKDGAPGVYIDDAKVAALGLRVKNGCSYHGLSLNVDMDLYPFTAINPCGYAGLKVIQTRDLNIPLSVDEAGEQLAKHPQLALAGDFNIAPEDRDVHDPAAWAGQILCSDDERAAFRRLLALGLKDSFRLFAQPEKSFSWWDYRMMAFRRNFGLRIDHILLSAPLAARATRCWVDKAPRKLERPSDHAPVVVELG